MESKDTQNNIEFSEELQAKRAKNFQVNLIAFGFATLIIAVGIGISCLQNQPQKLVPGSWSSLQRDDYLNGRQPNCGTYGCVPNDPMSQQMYH